MRIVSPVTGSISIKRVSLMKKRQRAAGNADDPARIRVVREVLNGPWHGPFELELEGGLAAAGLRVDRVDRPREVSSPEHPGVPIGRRIRTGGSQSYACQDHHPEGCPTTIHDSVSDL